MNRLLLLGILLCVGAGCIILFESISAMMTAGEIVFKMSSPVDFLGEAAFTWIAGIPVTWIQSALDWVVSQPAWLLILATGILCFILSGIRSR